MRLSLNDQDLEVDKIVIIDYLTQEERSDSFYKEKIQGLVSSNSLIEVFEISNSRELDSLLDTIFTNSNCAILQIISHANTVELGKLPSHIEQEDCKYEYFRLNAKFRKISINTTLIVNLMTVCGSYHYNKYIFNKKQPQYFCLIGAVRNSPYLTSIENSKYFYRNNGIISTDIEERINHINEDQHADFGKPESISYDLIV